MEPAENISAWESMITVSPLFLPFGSNGNTNLLMPGSIAANQ